MKKIAISFPLACLLLFNGCATNNAFMDNIGKIGGTTAGAGVGAVVGKQLGGRGGLIAGALIGGTIGYLIGDEIDKRRAEKPQVTNTNVGDHTFLFRGHTSCSRKPAISPIAP